MRTKPVKTATLPDDVISFIEEVAESEHRSFSNSREAIVRRYQRISEQLKDL